MRMLFGARSLARWILPLALAALAPVGGGCASPPDAPPASPLFQDLFGAHDADLSGASCHRSQDDCRGSTALLVCTDGTCQPCASDAECLDEYTYFSSQGGTFVSCGADHHCHAASGDSGACAPGTPACRTAAGWYPCVDGACARCTTVDDCTSSYGPNWQCGNVGPAGACVESVPPGP